MVYFYYLGGSTALGHTKNNGFKPKQHSSGDSSTGTGQGILYYFLI